MKSSYEESHEIFCMSSISCCRIRECSSYEREKLRNVSPLSASSEHGSNLVDPASSHMLVSKIKPCMCKYSYLQRNCEWLIKSVIIYLMDKDMDNRRNSRANTCVKACFGVAVFIR